MVEAMTLKARTERQQRLLDVLLTVADPVTGNDLAVKCGVTRQVVVHDIALLRASGIDILSTPRGYYLQTDKPTRERSVLAVWHGPERTDTELYTLVDCGVHVIDVIVEHPLYGELRGPLHLTSRREVDLFRNQVDATSAPLLSSLTDGHHLHTVEYRDARSLEAAVAALRARGIQVFDS